MKFKHILVTTDLSEAAERAFDYARTMAEESGAKVTLLHVVEATRVVPHGAPFAPPMPSPGLDGVLANAKEATAKQAAAFEGLDLNVAVDLAGDVAPAINAAVVEHGCDVVVISTHGRSGLRRLVLGSVAEAVLRHVHVPVLCVPALEG
ncbi:MAG: universal stress protein [Myxococcales bacterium]|nr:universal stress protein [Myxococcales bacterium]